jgi:hypothetical protein
LQQITKPGTGTAPMSPGPNRLAAQLETMIVLNATFTGEAG